MCPHFPCVDIARDQTVSQRHISFSQLVIDVSSLFVFAGPSSCFQRFQKPTLKQVSGFTQDIYVVQVSQWHVLEWHPSGILCVASQATLKSHLRLATVRSPLCNFATFKSPVCNSAALTNDIIIRQPSGMQFGNPQVCNSATLRYAIRQPSGMQFDNPQVCNSATLRYAIRQPSGMQFGNPHVCNSTTLRYAIRQLSGANVGGKV